MSKTVYEMKTIAGSRVRGRHSGWLIEVSTSIPWN
jgi:hypothetical protein